MIGLAAFVRQREFEREVVGVSAEELRQRIIESRTHRDATWACGDGRHVRVQAMSASHLFYALAKGERGEYPDSASRQQGMKALQAEALRRLAGLPGTAAQDAALVRGSRR